MTRILAALGAVLFLVPELFAQSVYCTPPKAMPKNPPSDPPPALCEPRECNKCTTSPCYVDSGIYVADAQDLSIPTNGFPLRVSRHYDSSLTVDGPLGVGWASSATPHLYYATYLFASNVYQYEVDVIMPDGAQYRFTDNGNGTFAPPAGRRDTLTRNANGTFTMTLQRSRSVYAFGVDGSLASMSDDFGNTLVFAYNPNGRIQTISDASGSGRSLTIDWNAQGRIADVHDTASPSRYVRYTYNADGTLAGVQDPVTASGVSTAYTYTAGRFAPVLAGVNDRWGRTITRLTWQSDGKLSSYTEGEYSDANPSSSTGEKYLYTYDYPLGNAVVTRKTDSLGTVNHTYTTGGLVTDHAQYDVATGNVTSTTDGSGAQTSYQYDGRGNVTRVSRSVPNDAFHPCCTMPANWNYAYDTSFPDQVSSITPTTAEGNPLTSYAAWTYEYYGPAEPAPGALKIVRRYNSSRTATENMASYTYDAKGHMLTAADNLGRASSYTYDAAGNTTTVTSGGLTTTYTYDAVGRVLSSTDPAGHATVFTYDALDRNLTVTVPRPSGNSPLSFVTTYSYDNLENGLVYVDVTDANGHLTRSGYDALGHLVRTVDALGNATVYTYRYNLLKSLTDANGNITSYSYDTDRNLIGTTFPDGAVESYQTGWDGTLLSSTDRRGITTSFTRDGLGRVLNVAYTSGSTALGGTSYTFDGEMLSAVTAGPTGQQQQFLFAHDPFWRLTSETRTDDYTITYQNSTGYQSGNSGYTVAPVSGQVGPTYTVTYGFDAYRRINSIGWNAVPGSFAIEYNALGQYSRITFPNGMTREFSYDDQGRLTAIANRSLENIATFQYGYDYDGSGAATLLGQRTTMIASGSATLNRQTRYAYDADYQLTSVTEGGGTQSWQYDAIGNRTYAGFPWTYYRNGTNPLNGQRLRSDGGADITYDANGNMTGRVGQVLYSWDYANRLTSAAAASTSYAYDYLGRRISTTWNGQVTRYISQGLNTIAERTTTTWRDYLFAPGLDEPLAMVENGTPYYYAVDGLGSIVATTDGSASVVAAAAYDAWGGATTLRSSGIAGLFSYTGRENDSIGLYYRARWYMPAWGRFLGEDPIRSHRFLEGYRYVRNRPTTYIDPLGTTWWDKTYGLPPQFWNWYHRFHKPKGAGDGTKEEIKEAYDEWVREGRPDIKKKWRRSEPKPDDDGEPGEEPDPSDSNSPAKVCIPCLLQPGKLIPRVGALIVGGGTIAVYNFRKTCERMIDAMSGAGKPCACGTGGSH